MKRVIFALGILFVFACTKTEVPAVSPTTVAPSNPVSPTLPIIATNYKNYLQPSYDLRKTNIWIDNYSIPKLNGVSIING